MSHFTFTRAADELSLSNHLLGTFLTEIGYEVPRSDRIAQIPVEDVEKWRNHPWVKAQSGVPPPHHITAEEAATRLGVTKYRVCDLMSNGKLRGRSFGPRRVVRIADVERYLNTRQKRTPPQLALKPGQMSRAQVCERLGISGRTLMDEVVNKGHLEIIARHGLATIFSAEQVEQFAQTELARRFDRSVPEGYLSVAAAAKVLRVDEDQVHGFIVKYGLPHVTVRRAHCPELAATKALAKRFATRRRAHAGKEIDGFLSGAKVLRRYKLRRFQLERLIAEFAIETKRIEHRLYVGPFPQKAEELAKDMAEANSYLSGRVKGWRIAAKVRKSLGITTSQEDALVERNVLQRKTLDCHAFLSTPTEEARAAAKAFRTELSVIRGEAPSKLLDTNKLCETLGVQRGDLPALIELGLIRETKSFRRKVYDRPTKQEIEQIEAWKRAKAEIQTEIETLSNDTNMQTVLAFRREHGLSQAQIGLLIRENIVVVKRVGERIFIPKQTDEVLETVQFRARARAIEKGTPKKEDRNLRTAEMMEARLGLTTPTFRTIREAGLIPTKTIGEKMFYSMPDQSAQARIKELKVGYRLNTSKSGKTGEYVTARYAANALGISDDARRHLVKHGVLHKQRFGRAVGFRKADIDRWIGKLDTEEKRFEACWITFDEAAERVGSFDALFEYDTRVGFPPLKVVERGIFLSRPTVEALAAALAQSRDETALSGSYDRYLPVSRVLKTLGINKQRLRALMQYRVLTPRKLRGILLFSQSQLSRTNGELPPREKRFTTTWIELFEAAEMVGSQAILFLCEELKLIPPPLVRGDNVLYRRRAIEGLLARRGSGEIDRVEESMGRTSTEQALEILDLADAELLGALERSTIIQRTTDPHRPYFRAEIEWYARQMEE